MVRLAYEVPGREMHVESHFSFSRALQASPGMRKVVDGDCGTGIDVIWEVRHVCREEKGSGFGTRPA